MARHGIGKGSTSTEQGERMINFTITLTGTSPLLMHNSRLSNPLDPATKALKKVTGKRNKTDDDHEQIARLEFAGSLYLDPDIGPYIPGENISRCLVDGAKLTKMGVKVTRGVFISTDVNPLSYDGPRSDEGLWQAGYRHMASVKIGTSRTMRCRPWFPEWCVQADGVLDPSVLELDDIASIADNAGSLIGLGDWRPRFGRFAAVVQQTVKDVAA
jgi:hypothetical protein